MKPTISEPVTSDQQTPGYTPGSLPEERLALEAVDAAKAEFVRAKENYDRIASDHAFMLSSSTESDGEAKVINEKIRDELRGSSGRRNKALIDLCAEKREKLEMVENYMFLADECKVRGDDAYVSASRALNHYKASRLKAADLISENMLASAVAGLDALWLAMGAREMAMRMDQPNNPVWHQVHDSLEAALLTDVGKRIASRWRSVSNESISASLPPQLAERPDVGDIKPISPAEQHMARVAAGKAASGNAIA